MCFILQFAFKIFSKKKLNKKNDLRLQDFNQLLEAVLQCLGWHHIGS